MIYLPKTVIGLVVTMLATISSPAMAAIPADGIPTYDPQVNSGLYVWRESGGSWRVRLLSGGIVQGFSGVIQSSEPFTLVRGLSLETTDAVKQTGLGTLEFNLKVAATGQDGLNFRIPDKASVCLRGTATFGTVIYLGAGAVPMTAPVDLTNSGACATPYTPAVSKVLKYHPGHYISMNLFDDQKAITKVIYPGVVGIQKRYKWGALEPSFGQYDFSAIESDLNLVASQGMQLIVFLEDKTFTNEKPTPPYLWDANTLPNRAGGYTAKRWSPYVISHMTALLQKLGERFDGHPNFEGVAIQESSLSLTNYIQALNDYSPEAYRDALTAILMNARFCFPTSQVFWYMNFLDGNQAYIADIAAAVAPYRVSMGGPDVLPDAWTLVSKSYPYYDQFQGKMTLFGSMQYESYGHLHKNTTYPTKYWTMDEMFRFTRDGLHANYIFWNRKNWRDPLDSYDWTDALPVIASNPHFN